MEASEGDVWGIVVRSTKVKITRDCAGIESIGERARSDRGGRGVRICHLSSKTQRDARSILSGGVS